MSIQRRYDPTPEQLALAKARKDQRLNNAGMKPKDGTLELKTRPWLPVPAPNLEASQNMVCHGQIVKIMTWNILAQSLIRRDLFPASDCLKAGQREPIIHAEILRQDAHILVLQEADRLEKLLPLLENAGFSHRYASGLGKQHGCLVAFKTGLYTLVSSKVVYYDTEFVGHSAQREPRIGSTFRTRNIGLIVALRSNTRVDEGLVVATTHLFWHPKYTYERIRQVAILLRETTAFRNAESVTLWPCILAGDFNFSPTDPAYSLIMGDSLLPEQIEMIKTSSVVHVSIDPSVSSTANTANSTPAEEEAETVDPDRVITSARPANSQDGLLSVSEIITLFSDLPCLRSAYSEGFHQILRLNETIPTYGSRISIPSGRHGAVEPEYTSYTHYWKTVLDYIFFLDPVNTSGHITNLLEPPKHQDMTPGLPLKAVSGSDHICLVVELTWPAVRT